MREHVNAIARHPGSFIGLNWVFDEVFAQNAAKTIFEKEGVAGIGFNRPININTQKTLD
jgi:hypothetical protein